MTTPRAPPTDTRATVLVLLLIAVVGLLELVFGFFAAAGNPLLSRDATQWALFAVTGALLVPAAWLMRARAQA